MNSKWIPTFSLLLVGVFLCRPIRSTLFYEDQSVHWSMSATFPQTEPHFVSLRHRNNRNGRSALFYQETEVEFYLHCTWPFVVPLFYPQYWSNHVARNNRDSDVTNREECGVALENCTSGQDSYQESTLTSSGELYRFEEAISGQTKPKEVTSGQAGPKGAISGHTMRKEDSSGQTWPKEATPGQTRPEEATSGHSNSEEYISGQFSSSEEAASGPIRPKDATSGQSTSESFISDELSALLINFLFECFGFQVPESHRTGQPHDRPKRSVLTEDTHVYWYFLIAFQLEDNLWSQLWSNGSLNFAGQKISFALCMDVPFRTPLAV